MNVIKLMGGLGNQLYQYAFGQVQKANGIDIAYDLSWFNHYHTGVKRDFNLDKFEIDILPVNSFLKQQEIRESGYNPELLNVSNCNLFGYWQYLSYYTSILTTLKSIIKVRSSLYTPEYIDLKNKAENYKTTAIHVRRGDYLFTKGFNTLPLSYYYQALQETDGDLIYIFSEDREWCKKSFTQSAFKRKLIFIDLPDFLTWDLMRVCQNQIIANSSFSQFAAFLNPNKDKKVIYSSIITMKGEEERQQHFPKEWIKL